MGMDGYGLTRSLATDEEIEKLHESALKVLARTGMRFPSKTLLGYLSDFGAEVDLDKEVARFPGAVIEKTIDLLRKDDGGGDGADGDGPAQVPETFRVTWGSACPFYHDFENDQRRPATRDDTIAMIRLADAMPEVRSVPLALVNAQTAPEMEALEGVELLLANSSKPAATGVRSTEQLKYFVEIDNALGHGADAPRFVQAGRCIVSPLNLGREAALYFEEMLRLGYDRCFWYGTMPLSGATGPATPAGTVCLTVAELLGCFALSKAINPVAQCSATVITGAMNMRSGTATYTSPEAVLQNAAIWQFFKRRVPARVGFARGNYTSAKQPGSQAAYEKTLSHMGAAMYANFFLKVGSLDGERLFSPVQAMIDLDFAEGVWRTFRGLEISDETLAVDEIARVGCLGADNYLRSEHTMEHFCDALWTPRLFDCGPWADYATESRREQELLEAASEAWRNRLAEWRAPEVDESALRAVRDVIASARNELLD